MNDMQDLKHKIDCRLSSLDETNYNVITRVNCILFVYFEKKPFPNVSLIDFKSINVCCDLADIICLLLSGFVKLWCKNMEIYTGI